MSMESGESPKIEQPAELNPEWNDAVLEGITDVMHEYFGGMYKPDNPPQETIAISFSPAFLTGGIDDRRFTDLRQNEQEFITSIFFAHLEFDPDVTESTDTYISTWQEDDGTPRTGQVNVYPTAQSHKGMFLHEVTFPDNGKEKKDYYIAPKEFRI